jgi:hypothetical protein
MESAMQHPRLATSLALCLAALPALADAPRMLRGADCLDPGMARNWTELDNRTILVDAGRRKYRIGITPGCAAIGFSPSLGFKGDPVSGRVCGGVSDLIITREYSCRIERMELIDAAQFKLLQDSRKGKHKQKPVSHSGTP